MTILYAIGFGLIFTALVIAMVLAINKAVEFFFDEDDWNQR